MINQKPLLLHRADFNYTSQYVVVFDDVFIHYLHKVSSSNITLMNAILTTFMYSNETKIPN